MVRFEKFTSVVFGKSFWVGPPAGFVLFFDLRNVQV